MSTNHLIPYFINVGSLDFFLLLNQRINIWNHLFIESLDFYLRQRIEPSCEPNEPSRWQTEMPYEILLKIFGYFMREAKGDVYELEKVRNVCQFWSQVADDGRLLFDLNLRLYFMRYKYSGYKLRSLFQHLNKSAMAEKFQHVRTLNLSTLDIQNKDLEFVLKKCGESLHSLDISRCKHLKMNLLDQNVMCLIGSHCPSLNSLKMSGFDDVMI